MITKGIGSIFLMTSVLQVMMKNLSLQRAECLYLMIYRYFKGGEIMIDLRFGDEVENRSFDCSYSWGDMANALTDHNIPHEVVRTLADVPMAMIMKRPILNMFKFDDYLHDQYGDYESEGKSMKDMFKKLFW